MAILVPPSFVVDQIEFAYPNSYREFITRTLAGLRTLSNPDRIFLTSWFRDPAHNRDVGGHAQSQHLVGLALDLAVPDSFQAERALDAQGIVAVQGRGGRHVHVQFFPRDTISDEIDRIWRQRLT